MELASEATDATDAAGWVYANVPGESYFGSIFVNCTHTDSKGTLWEDY